MDEDLPQVDEFGLLRKGGRWIALTPLQERLMQVLLERFERPIARRDLIDAIWPDAPPTRTIDTQILRLRQRIKPMGLTIQTIRGRGWVLTAPHGDTASDSAETGT